MTLTANIYLNKYSNTDYKFRSSILHVGRIKTLPQNFLIKDQPNIITQKPSVLISHEITCQ